MEVNTANLPKPNPAEIVIRWDRGVERQDAVADLTGLIQKGLSAKATFGLNYFFWVSNGTIGLWMVFEHLEVGSLQRVQDLCGEHAVPLDNLAGDSSQERDRMRTETMSKAEHTYIGWADLRVGFESFQIKMKQAP